MRQKSLDQESPRRQHVTKLSTLYFLLVDTAARGYVGTFGAALDFIKTAATHAAAWETRIVYRTFTVYY